jgi:two-component system, chemotaxis family, CheB/CheR fusion protein
MVIQSPKKNAPERAFRPPARSAGETAQSLDYVEHAKATVFAGDGYFRAVFDLVPTAIYTTDANGLLTYYNEAAAVLWGRRPKIGEEWWCGAWELYWPDGSPLPLDQCPMAIAVKEGRAVRGLEAVVQRPDGTRVPVTPFPTPLYDTSGALVGAVNVVLDLTDRHRAHQHDQRLAAIIDSSDDAIVSKDLDGTITSWNRGAERLFGYTADEIVGQSVTILIPPDRPNEEAEVLWRIRRGERIDHFETVRRRKDGSLVEISLTISPIKDAIGRVVGASKIARDITERRRAQEQQALVIGEIKHRIKNTLQTVQAIASQTLRGTSTEDRSAFAARLQALASAHDLLTLESWNRAPLRDVVGRVLQPFQEKHHERFLIVASGDLWLSADRSVLLALVLHELATNAVKYGALSNGDGQVSLTWKMISNGDPAKIVITWIESGGPPVKPPENKGFGSLLIERVVGSELGAVRFNFPPEGVTCILEITL